MSEDKRREVIFKAQFNKKFVGEKIIKEIIEYFKKYYEVELSNEIDRFSNDCGSMIISRPTDICNLKVYDICSEKFPFDGNRFVISTANEIDFDAKDVVMSEEVPLSDGR